MKLSDVRKLAIRQQSQIRFLTVQGIECIVDEHGVARAPKLARPPHFNLEEELSKATDFVIHSTSAKASPRSLGRLELEQMIAASSSSSSTIHDQEE